MTRSRQIFSIYAVLRRTLGDTFSPRLIMACAVSVVDLFLGSNEDPEFELRTGGVSFCRWALDRALADGGWRVLALEGYGEGEPGEDEMDRVDVKRIISQIEMEAYA
jgi:hypothetical protein